MATIAEIVGGNIRREREGAGLTQAELAKAAKVKLQSVYRWEKGKAWPTSRNIETLAKLFRTPPSSLFQQGETTPRDPRLRDAMAIVCRALGFSLARSVRRAG
jgi:transcriptional regulator with XRE-family HTH domain